MKLIKNVLQMSVLALALGVLLAGCAKNEEEPIDLPPTLSFVVDYDSFPATVTTKAGFEVLAANDYSQSSFDVIQQQLKAVYAPSYAAGTDFSRALLTVAVWKVITDLGLVIPRLAFLESFKHKPERQNDGSWVWSYSYSFLLQTYTAKLVGKIDGTDVVWEMYLSKSGTDAYTDFNWYSGRHDIAATSGTWTLRKSPTEAYDYVGITWARDVNAGTATIKYTNIIPAGTADAQVNENGGYVHYGTTTDASYNAFFNIYNKGADNLTQIEWNRTTKDGRMADPAFYSNTDWHYWDTTLANTAAP